MSSIVSQTPNENSQLLTNYSTTVSTLQRRLVKLEIDLVPQIRDKWEKTLADITTDRTQAEAAINALYENARLTQPRILWTENPLTAMMILLNRPDLVDVASSILSRIWTASEQEINRQIDPEFIRVEIGRAHV